MNTSAPRFDHRRLDHWLAFAGGAGLLPRAPGTWGTLAAVPLYLLLGPLPLAAYVGLMVLAFLWGIRICERVARELGQHDPGAIVWDEVVGYLVTMTAAPKGWIWPLAGFVLFRLLDVFKPWPISWADRRLHGGLGIMTDDLLAGIGAWFGLWVLAAGLTGS